MPNGSATNPGFPARAGQVLCLRSSKLPFCSSRRRVTTAVHVQIGGQTDKERTREKKKRRKEGRKEGGRKGGEKASLLCIYIEYTRLFKNM